MARQPRQGLRPLAPRPHSLAQQVFVCGSAGLAPDNQPRRVVSRRPQALRRTRQLQPAAIQLVAWQQSSVAAAAALRVVAAALRAVAPALPAEVGALPAVAAVHPTVVAQEP